MGVAFPRQFVEYLYAQDWAVPNRLFYSSSHLERLNEDWSVCVEVVHAKRVIGETYKKVGQSVLVSVHRNGKEVPVREITNWDEVYASIMREVAETVGTQLRVDKFEAERKYRCTLVLTLSLAGVPYVMTPHADVSMDWLEANDLFKQRQAFVVSAIQMAVRNHFMELGQPLVDRAFGDFAGVLWPVLAARLGSSDNPLTLNGLDARKCVCVDPNLADDSDDLLKQSVKSRRKVDL